MALSLTVTKANNSIGIDFKDAYFVIDTLRYEDTDSGNMTVFELNAYPDRESSKRTGQVVNPDLPFGHSMSSVYDGKIYTYLGVFRTVDIFGSSIPTDKDMQKRIIYPFIKEKFKNVPFEDVLED